MSLSKLVQNDYAHDGKPTFAKTRHGPLVMVNNHSTQVLEQHLAVGIRCKTPVWLFTLPLEVESVRSRIPICHCPCQGAGWPDKYRRMSKPWHSPLPTQPKPTTATRICPTSLPILRLDNIHASHSIPVDHVQWIIALDLLMHHYCQSSSLYCHLQTSWSLNLRIHSYAPNHCLGYFLDRSWTTEVEVWQGDFGGDLVDCPTQFICTWICICCSMTKLKEHSRVTC